MILTNGKMYDGHRKYRCWNLTHDDMITREQCAFMDKGGYDALTIWREFEGTNDIYIDYSSVNREHVGDYADLKIWLYNYFCYQR